MLLLRFILTSLILSLDFLNGWPRAIPYSGCNSPPTPGYFRIGVPPNVEAISLSNLLHPSAPLGHLFNLGTYLHEGVGFLL